MFYNKNTDSALDVNGEWGARNKLIVQTSELQSRLSCSLELVSSHAGTVLPTAEMSPPQVCEMSFKYFVASASDSPPLASDQTLGLPTSWEHFGSGWGDFFRVLLIHYH